MEWEKRVDVFAMAVMAKDSISIEELTRTVDNDDPRINSLLGGYGRRGGGQESGHPAVPVIGRTCDKVVQGQIP